MCTSKFPSVRPRRLRKNGVLRSIFAETHVTAADLVYPLFVEEDIAEKLPIASMPGVFRVPERQLADEVAALYRDGVKAVILFGVSHHKTEDGCDSWDENGLLARMIRTAKQAAPNMVVICDNCVCEYTTHGHCGVVVNGYVDNDLTLENLAKQVITAARAGADLVAPSSMMDGQVGYLRQSLDAAGFSGMPIMAYSTKFASSFYGPFRMAAQSSVQGDRRGYQIDPPNGREGIRESLLDEAEGADILMVKPGMPYLDILARLREKNAPANRRLPGKRRVRDDQVRRGGRGDRRKGCRPRNTRCIQACRCGSGYQLFCPRVRSGSV